MKKILSVCCLVLLGNLGIALSQSSKPRGYDPLLTKLNSVKSLSNYDRGFGGSNEFYKLSKEFLDSHDPSDFRRMVNSRNPIVKAMGLLCLAQLDSDEYWFTLFSHAKDNEEVYLHEGCGVSRITIGEFAQRLLSNPHFLDPEEKRSAI